MKFKGNKAASLRINAPSSSILSSMEQPSRTRRPSVVSLPPQPLSLAARARKTEEGDQTIPYADGPVQIIPGIWLGSEDNAHDWPILHDCGIRSILNVAKEVASPFASDAASRPLRTSVSSPNLSSAMQEDDTYYPPNPANGRPGMHYLKLVWSHGQQDLVENGFQAAMAFTDAALERGDGVLVHCQCGISRSATMVIALVMRAASERSPSVPSEIWALKGMHGAYTFVKEKSKWVSPNMSLIYQLLEYERKLRGDTGSPTSSERSSQIADEEEEWGRRRRLLDEAPSDPEEDDYDNAVIREAKALDKAMEDRIVARKSSSSSIASSSGIGMGAAWRSRFTDRKRTGSITSNGTDGSILSEDLVEEDEEEELLGIGGGFDSDHGGSAELEITSATNSLEDDNASGYSVYQAPSFSVPKLRPPPSTPSWKSSFSVPPPPSATRSTFNIPPPSATQMTFSLKPPPKQKKRPATFGALASATPSPVIIIDSGEGSSLKPPPKQKKRPAALGALAPVPPSPVPIIIDSGEPSDSGEEFFSKPLLKQKRRPAALAALAPVVPPPITIIIDTGEASESGEGLFVPTQSSQPLARPIRPKSQSLITQPATTPQLKSHASRMRTDSVRKPAPPPLHLRSSVLKKANRLSIPNANSVVSTPSQTLFVFPPSPTQPSTPYANMARTPSTMTLTGSIPFPTSSTPRVSTFRGAQGRTRSFIGLACPTPTTASSFSVARGYIGLEF